MPPLNDNLDKTLNKKLEDILEEYKPTVSYIVGKFKDSFVSRGMDEGDLTQEAMIALVKAYNKYDENGGASFRTFASVCINNKLLSLLRAGDAEKEFLKSLAYLDDNEENEDSPINSVPAKSDDDPEFQVIYKEMLEVLLDPENTIFTEMERAVLEKLLEGYKYTEIANMLGNSPKQIDNTIQRIKKKIKGLFD